MPPLLVKVQSCRVRKALGAWALHSYHSLTFNEPVIIDRSEILRILGDTG